MIQGLIVVGVILIFIIVFGALSEHGGGNTKPEDIKDEVTRIFDQFRNKGDK